MLVTKNEISKDQLNQCYCTNVTQGKLLIFGLNKNGLRVYIIQYINGRVMSQFLGAGKSKDDSTKFEYQLILAENGRQFSRVAGYYEIDHMHVKLFNFSTYPAKEITNSFLQTGQLVLQTNGLIDTGVWLSPERIAYTYSNNDQHEIRIIENQKLLGLVKYKRNYQLLKGSLNCIYGHLFYCRNAEKKKIVKQQAVFSEISRSGKMKKELSIPFVSYNHLQQGLTSTQVFPFNRIIDEYVNISGGVNTKFLNITNYETKSCFQISSIPSDMKINLIHENIIVF
eukprot:TRINITY_DN7449_c0_g1_i2.p1 TRINITY_DN7449_c0_g1~~TRINITY_DN7449_c0_g1_i2.p1  ORF type:complete len:283 (-),score=30.23 TRINITY_DN7449_c0_g1_i2:479-1327(-)